MLRNQWNYQTVFLLQAFQATILKELGKNISQQVSI